MICDVIKCSFIMLDVHVRVSLPNFIRLIISFYTFFSLFATITAFNLNVFRKTDFIIALEVHILQLPPGRDKIIINCTDRCIGNKQN